MSEGANVEGTRVLTTIDVSRAVSGQVGSGSGVVQRFKSSICTYTMRASASIWIPTTHSMGAHTILYGPIHGEHNLFFLAGGSNEVSSNQWGMRAPPLYYRSCASDGVWQFAAARAPHHMIRTGPVVPKKA